MKRRDFLKWGLLSGLAGLAGCASLRGAGFGKTVLGDSAVVPFQMPLPIPPILAPVGSTPTEDYYEITMAPAQLQILPPGSPKTTVWAYNGMVPGPTIVAKKGKAVRVKQTNNLGSVTHRDGTQVDVTVHLHGGHVPAIDDGHPNDLIQPIGKSKPALPIKYQLYPDSAKEYHYPNNQDHATLWYHDHADDHTGENVYMGLAGFYILHDDLELGLNLPSGDYDVPIVIQDKLFNPDGSLSYPPLNMNTLQSGFFGKTIVVNGAVQPYFQVANRKYRFRILNGSNGRQYKLALSSGAFIQIGTEGGLLPAPVTRPSILIGQAERYDVVIDFSKYPVGTQVILQNTLSSPGSSTFQIMRFDVARQETDPSVIPSTLRPIVPLTGSVMNRSWELAFNGADWTLNNQVYDMNRIDAAPTLNSVETWAFSNFSNVPHPMHPHAGMFQIVGHPELGWKDTFNVRNGETLRIIMPFTDYTGDYMLHCHNLEHEDNMMMTQFRLS
jgi:spore coat protein A